jgi:hypothetical protein
MPLVKRDQRTPVVDIHTQIKQKSNQIGYFVRKNFALERA